MIIMRIQHVFSTGLGTSDGHFGIVAEKKFAFSAFYFL